MIECRLKVIFAERNIKQKEFALRVKIDKTTLSLLANNKTLPTLEVAYRIADELELPVTDIWIKKIPPNQ
jgi:putative transcriptional regulator